MLHIPAKNSGKPKAKNFTSYGGSATNSLQETEKAIEDYKLALAILPDDTTFETIAHYYYQLERYPEALQWVKNGLDQHPNSVTLWHALAKITQRAATDWHESLPLYVKTAELEGTARFYNMTGGVCWSYGDYACAVDHLDMAIAREPENLLQQVPKENHPPLSYRHILFFWYRKAW